MGKIYIEDLSALWGEAFTRECIEDARTLIAVMRGHADSPDEPLLVFAVAIKKIKESKT